jgi:hypothetical protein
MGRDNDTVEDQDYRLLLEGAAEAKRASGVGDSR